MRRMILVAATAALFFGLVPAVSGAQDVNAQEVGSVHIVNGLSPLFQAFPDPVQVCEGDPGDLPGTLLATVDGPSLDGADVTTGTADIELSGGVHNIFISGPSGGNGACMAPAAPTNPSINVLGGQNNTAILNGSASQAGVLFGITFGQNDNSNIPAGTARLTLRNGNTLLAQFPAPSMCLDGEKVAGMAAVPFNTQNQTEVAAKTYSVGLDIPGLTDGCEGDTEVNLAACTHIALNLYAGTDPDNPAGIDNEFFVIDCELATSAKNAAAFCLVVNPDLPGIASTIETLFAPVKVGDTATYPSAAQLEYLVKSINNTTAAGDATVPDTIKPQWLILTDGFRTLSAGLTAAGYDLNSPLLDDDAVQQLVDFALGSGTPDPEVTGATEVLTGWYLANCIPTATPSFTG